jgi:hypothetical protein
LGDAAARVGSTTRFSSDCFLPNIIWLLLLQSRPGGWAPMTRRGVGAFDAIGKIDRDRFRFGFYCLSMVVAET